MVLAALPVAASTEPDASAAKATQSSGTPDSAGGRVPAQERLPLGAARPVGGVDVAPDKVATPSTIAGSSLQVSLALAIVIGLIVGIGVVVRKVAARGGGLLGAIGPGGRSPSGVIEVLGRFPLARGMTLVLLKLDRRVLLVSMGLGRAGGSMQTLCEISDPDEVASLLLRTRDEAGESIARQFAGLLQREDQAAENALKLAPQATPRQPSASRPRATPGSTGTVRSVNGARPGAAPASARPTLEVRA